MHSLALFPKTDAVALALWDSIDDTSVNIILKHNYVSSHLNKNKVNTKIIMLRADILVPKVKRSLEAIAFKLWQLICEMYMERPYKFDI